MNSTTVETATTATTVTTAAPIVTSSKIKWTNEMKYILMKAVYVRKAHISTKDLTMEQKFQLIKASLLDVPEFKSLGQQFIDFKPPSLMEKFRKLLDEVDQKYGITKAGSNLSGLDEMPSEYEKLVLEMLREKAAKQIDKKSLTEKEKVFSGVLNSINNSGMASQGKLSSVVLLPANKSFSSIDSNGLESSPGSSEGVDDDYEVIEVNPKNRKTSGSFTAIDYIDQVHNKLAERLVQPPSSAKSAIEEATLAKLKKEEEMQQSQKSIMMQ